MSVQITEESVAAAVQHIKHSSQRESNALIGRNTYDRLRPAGLPSRAAVCSHLGLQWWQLADLVGVQLRPSQKRRLRSDRPAPRAAKLDLSTIDPSQPIVDVTGRLLRRVRVSHGELTCTGCGETTGDHCPRCATDEGGVYVKRPPALVPTVSYLRPGEYEGG